MILRNKEESHITPEQHKGQHRHEIFVETQIFCLIGPIWKKLLNENQAPSQTNKLYHVFVFLL